MRRRKTVGHVLLGLTAAVTIGLLWTAPAWSGQDPVDDLRRALTVRPDIRSKQSLAFREQILKERVAALRTIGELRRALLEWKVEPGGEIGAEVQVIDEKMRGVVGKRLSDLLARAARSPQSETRLAVATLIAELDTTVPSLNLGDRHGYARGLTDIVVGLSRDPEPAVRLEALRALGNINPDPAKAIPVLADKLEKGQLEEVRRMAADSLGRLLKTSGNLSKKQLTQSAPVWASTAELIQTAADVTTRIGAASDRGAALSDPDVGVRILSLNVIDEAVKAFSDVPSPFKREEFPPTGRTPSAEEKVNISRQYDRVQKEIEEIAPLLKAMSSVGPYLSQALVDPNPKVSVASAAALEGLSHVRLRLDLRSESLPRLEGLKRPAQPVEFEKMILASRPAAARVLEQPSLHPNEVRLRAIEFLEDIRDDALPELQAMIVALRDPDRFVRWDAARAIGNLPGNEAEAAAPQLAVLLNDYDVDVRLAATNALQHFGPAARATVPALEQAVLDTRSDPEFRVAIMNILAAAGPEVGKSAVPVLIRSLSDSDARVRRTAAEVLGKYGRLATSALPALRRALLDEDAEVRTRASDAILNIQFGSKKEL